MRVLFVAGMALLVLIAGTANLSAQQSDFKRPDVVPLPAEGKFQIVSQTPWPGDKVRVFFLGAQF
jgi:hypothetical protein